MKKFDLKSFAAGLLIGTLGITTAFAAAGILSADLCDTKVTLKGAPLSLNHPLISVTMEDGQEPKLYMPADELLTSLGYTLHYDNGKNTVDLLPGNASLPDAVSYGNGDSVIALTNRPEQRNIAESGAFQAEDNLALVRLRFRFHNLKNPFRARRCRKNRVHLLGNLVDGLADLPGVLEKRRQVP